MGDANTTIGTAKWDTVSGLRIAHVNAEIESAKSSPPSFAYQASDGNVRVEGKFGTWRITAGGGGNLIHMALPVSTCSVSVMGGTPAVVSDFCVVLEIELQYLSSQKQPAAEEDGHLLELRVKGANGESDGNGSAASWVDATYKTDPGFEAKSAIRMALPAWAGQHLGEFQHVFATVNINKKLAHNDFQWMVPTATSYAYVDGDTEADSVLGILCMTENRSPDGLAQEVSPGIIPKSADVGFLVSPERLLEKLIHPHVPSIFPGTTLEDFPLSPDGTQISLNSGSPVAFDITVKNKTKPCTLKEFKLYIDDTDVSVYSVTQTQVAMQIQAFCRMTAWQGITLGSNNAGQQTLVFNDAKQPEVDHWTEQTEKTIISEEIAEIVLVVIGTLTAIFTDGASEVLVAFLFGLLTAATTATPLIIEMVKNGDAPAVDLLVANATGAIEWGSNKGLTLVSAGLHGALQLGLKFSSN